MEMLEDIAALTGKGGLFRVLKPGKAGVVVESLDKNKTRIMVSASTRMTRLHETSIYAHNKDGVVPLETVLRKIHDSFGDSLPVTATSSPEELKGFMKGILPEYNEERVYQSDIKKLIKWYAVMLKELPEMFKQPEAEKAADNKDADGGDKKSKAPKKKKSTE